ncbi:hypothetical protein DL96DRAFT_1707732 [Flagelloscypha sp. PMI_526]|nr:hypothetical protein DL96DRAFT_1707732 [Flagelloscypha sp. PMI_526]
MATPDPPSLVTLAGPPLLAFFFNLILSGVLIVQVRVISFCPALLISYCKISITLEMLQTVIQCYDKFELYAKEFGNVANLDKGRLSWFSIAILTGAIVQAFLGWKIFTLSKNWYIASFIWALTLLSAISGMVQGVLVFGMPISELSCSREWEWYQSMQIFFIATAVDDVIIAGVLTYYLHRMRSGIKTTDKVITKIITLTVETGSITDKFNQYPLGAIIIVITSFVAPPWFLVLTDCKLYANNLMVMFNRRLTIAHHPSSQSDISGNTQLNTFKARRWEPCSHHVNRNGDWIHAVQYS